MCVYERGEKMCIHGFVWVSMRLCVHVCVKASGTMHLFVCLCVCGCVTEENIARERLFMCIFLCKSGAECVWVSMCDYMHAFECVCV